MFAAARLRKAQSGATVGKPLGKKERELQDAGTVAEGGTDDVWGNDLRPGLN